MVSIALACSGQRYTVHHYQTYAIRIFMACNIGCLLANILDVLWSIFGFSCAENTERNA
jgi:hypothetical protein